MTDENEWIDEDGFRWEGTREELEAWKRYKKTKALSFVERGYSVGWYPDGDNWMKVYVPERHQIQAPEIMAEIKFYGHPSKFGIDGGMVSKLAITETRTDLAAYVLGRPWQRTRVLYNFDRGPDVNRLRTTPEGLRLYGAVLEETTDTMARKVSLGSIISGTLRRSDLLRAFSDELEALDGSGRFANLISQARSSKIRSNAGPALLGELEAALGSLALPYTYFGAHRGDGADFGYWPDWDAIEADRRDGTLPSGDSLPADGATAPFYLHISDHGNSELYQWEAEHRRWRSVWGVV